MGIKTFFQPWLIQPKFPTFMGDVTEYDPLKEAYDLSVEATGWINDVVDQLMYANELYVDAAKESEVEIAHYEDRHAAALASMSLNGTVIGVLSVVARIDDPPEEPVAAEPNDVAVEVEPPWKDHIHVQGGGEPDSGELHVNPWYVPASDPEPPAPKKRRARKPAVEKSQETGLDLD
jgi:hypothetical protein